jgi:hypothetical protein
MVGRWGKVDGIVVVLLGAILVIALLRVVVTYRKAASSRSKGADIQRKLERLRKRRDEE